MDNRLRETVVYEHDDKTGAAHADPGYRLDRVQVCRQGVAHAKEEPGHCLRRPLEARVRQGPERRSEQGFGEKGLAPAGSVPVPQPNEPVPFPQPYKNPAEHCPACGENDRTKQEDRDPIYNRTSGKGPDARYHPAKCTGGKHKTCPEAGP